MRKLKHFYKALQMELREHRSSFMVYLILRILVIVVLCVQIHERNFESVFLSILTLLMLLIPSFVQVTFRIELPTILESIILLFIFAAAIGFSLVDILNKSEKLVFNLSPFFAVMVAFCFSMTIGVVWEIFEFGMDQIGGFDMQKDTVVQWISSVHLDPTGGNTPTALRGISEVYVNGAPLQLGGYLDIGLYDTMYDLIVNLIGAFVFSIFAYIYLKKKENEKLMGRFIMRRKRKEEDYLR